VEEKFLKPGEHLSSGNADPESIRNLPPEMKNQKEMRFSPPKLSDEEERSPHMPAYLLCDGCVAVATQVEVAFHNAHRHVNIERKLKHWDVIDTLESTCQYETFTDYGITDQGEKHRLKGPGLDPEIGAGGVSHMGGKWPGRLANMCSEMIGVFEDHEMEFYDIWKENIEDGMVEFLCRNHDRPEFGICLNVVEQGELVRDDIEDMIKTMGRKNNVEL